MMLPFSLLGSLNGVNSVHSLKLFVLFVCLFICLFVCLFVCLYLIPNLLSRFNLTIHSKKSLPQTRLKSDIHVYEQQILPFFVCLLVWFCFCFFCFFCDVTWKLLLLMLFIMNRGHKDLYIA